MTDTIMTLRSYASLKELVEKRIAGEDVKVPDVPMTSVIMRNIERRVIERASEQK